MHCSSRHAPLKPSRAVALTAGVPGSCAFPSEPDELDDDEDDDWDEDTSNGEDEEDEGEEEWGDPESDEQWEVGGNGAKWRPWLDFSRSTP